MAHKNIHGYRVTQSIYNNITVDTLPSNELISLYQNQDKHMRISENICMKMYWLNPVVTATSAVSVVNVA